MNQLLLHYLVNVWAYLLLCSAYVSFSLEGDTLSFEDVQQQILERREALADLDFSVLSLSQGIINTG